MIANLQSSCCNPNTVAHTKVRVQSWAAHGMMKISYRDGTAAGDVGVGTVVWWYRADSFGTGLSGGAAAAAVGCSSCFLSRDRRFLGLFVHELTE